jgi:hypothetical protein
MESGFILYTLARNNFSQNFQMTTSWKQILIPHIRTIMDRFVATGSVEKDKSEGRPPVNEEIIEDIRQ